MDYSFLNLLRVVKRFGAFSYPFINYALEKCSFSKGEIAWFKSIKYEGTYSYKLALDEVKFGLNACSDENLKFLLLSEKLELLRFLGRNKMADKLYSRMRKDLSFLSPSVRDIISVEFTAHRAFFQKGDCLGKINKEGKNLNDSAKAFIEINVGRGLAKNGKMEGLEHFKKAYDLAKSVPHPSGVITSLNALAWYGMNYDKEEAVNYAKEALYWMGWYFERPRLYVFDTALEVLNEEEDLSLYEVAKDFIFLYESSRNEEKKRYKKRYTQAKRILSTTLYKSDGKTRRFLRKLNKTNKLEEAGISNMEVFNILHSKVKNIRGETIRKILSKYPELFEEFELSKLPKGFACEMAKKKESIEDGIDTVIENKRTLDPFIQARKDLARKYLERMPKRVRERFISIYISLEEKDKSVIDRFLRDYIRYDIKWSMRIKAPKEMEKYVKSFHLKKTPCALAYWALDNQRERERLAEMLEKVE